MLALRFGIKAKIRLDFGGQHNVPGGLGIFLKGSPLTFPGFRVR